MPFSTGADGVLGAFADLVAGSAFEKYLLAGANVLGACVAHGTRNCQGGENANLKICHWPIRRFCVCRLCLSFGALQHKHAEFGNRILASSNNFVRIGFPGQAWATDACWTQRSRLNRRDEP
jgi:hypothetical protein